MMDDAERAEIAARLHAVAVHLLRRVRREDARSGLSAARLSALSVLVFGGPRTVGELASAEQVSAPTMTRLVAGLAADGYVARERSETDGRVVVVQATAKARRALEEGRARRVRHLLDLLAEAGDEDWRRIGAAVERLERALEGAGAATDETRLDGTA